MCACGCSNWTNSLQKVASNRDCHVDTPLMHQKLRKSYHREHFLTKVILVAGLFCSILTLLTPICDANPTRDESDGQQNLTDRIYQSGVDFLIKYAYLPQSDFETGALRTDEELKLSLRAFQEYAHIPVTGEFDELTKQQMLAPRCGLPDLLENTPLATGRGKRYVLSPSKWDKKHLTYRLLNYTPKLGYTQCQEAISRAFRIWSDVTPLTFTEVMYGYADIYIQFSRGYHADGYPFDGLGRVLAHAFYPGEDRGGDTHFDDDETWTLSTGEGTDLFTVAAHEFGHALGLAHSQMQGSLMYPWYQGYKPNFQLHYDDISAIQFLYGSKGPTVRPSVVIPPVTDAPYRPVTVPPTTTVRTTRPTLPSTTVEPTRKPGDCIGSYDAVAVIRQEMFLFKGKYFWRVNADGLMSGFPVLIHQFWYGFPPEIESVDAAYERLSDYRIVFFKGKNYYVFNGNHLESGFPKSGRPITELGLPHDIEKVDAAFVWGHNTKTYFISGDMYWKYDEVTKIIEDDYPRDMSMWRGVPLPVDAAVQHWDNDKTYFFKDDQFWEFDDTRMKVAPGYPQYSAQKWLNCTDVTSMKDGYVTETMPGSGVKGTPSMVVIFALHFLLLFL